MRSDKEMGATQSKTETGGAGHTEPIEGGRGVLWCIGDSLTEGYTWVRQGADANADGDGSASRDAGGWPGDLGTLEFHPYADHIEELSKGRLTAVGTGQSGARTHQICFMVEPWFQQVLEKAGGGDPVPVLLGGTNDLARCRIMNPSSSDDDDAEAAAECGVWSSTFREEMAEFNDFVVQSLVEIMTKASTLISNGGKKPPLMLWLTIPPLGVCHLRQNTAVWRTAAVLRKDINARIRVAAGRLSERLGVPVLVVDAAAAVGAPAAEVVPDLEGLVAPKLRAAVAPLLCMRPEMDSGDGLHMSVAGYRAIAAAVEAAASGFFDQ